MFLRMCKVLKDLIKDRSNRPEVFCKKHVVRNFVKFTGNARARVSFLINLQSSGLLFYYAVLKPATLLKQRLWHRCFPVNFAKFLRTFFFTEHLRTTASVVNKYSINGACRENSLRLSVLTTFAKSFILDV